MICLLTGLRKGFLLAAAVVVMALAQVAEAADVCSGPNFNVAPSIALGAFTPNSVAVADFNHDGFADLAIADGGTRGAAVLLGNGNGTFSAPTNFSTGGNGSESIVVADFNSDGNSDLAVSLNADKISILTGNGDGSFNSSIILTGGGTGPTSLTSGDFNNDTKPDLALTNANSNNVSIFINSGGGNFTGPTLFSSGFQPDSSAVAELNGDNKVDLVIGGASGVTVLLGTGAGGFGSPTSFTAAGTGSSVTVADFNSDGKSDVAVAHYFNNTITILFGTGSGSLTNSKNIIAGNNARFVTSGDLNGDGKIDLLAGNRDADTVSLFAGDGAGNFNRYAEYATGAGPIAIAAGNFNGDNNPDLAIGNVFSGDVSILKGTGAGNFAAPVSINLLNASNSGEQRSGPGKVLVGDFDGDGKSDLAVANFFSNDVSVMLGSGSGSFGPRSNFPAGTRLNDMAAGDFNSDGKTDLAVVTGLPDSVVIMLGNGNGGFSGSATLGTGTSPRGITTGDFNRDGRQDLAVSNGNFMSVSIYLGTGGGSFTSPTFFVTGSGPGSIVTADFNNDGNDDLAVTNSSSSVSVLIGDGLGGMGAPTSMSVGSIPSSIAFGDFDGDGKKDLAVTNSFSQLLILLGTGTGTFTRHLTIPTGFNPISVLVRDFNGDGTDDVGVTANHKVSIFLNAGSAIFTAPFAFYAGAFPGSFAPGDFNGDGRIDLALANSESNTLTILLGIPVSRAAGVQLCAATYYANETNKNAGIFVARSGDTSGTALVNYSTIDATASARSDYTQANGTLRFAPGETTKIINVLLSNDAFAEGTETFSLKLVAASGTALNLPTTSTVVLNDNDLTSGPSPVGVQGFDVQFFVRQHYLDFLNREPDFPGLNFWSGQISSCGNDAQCAEVRRINVSAAFFLSIEFKETGYLVERVHKTAFGDATGTSTLGGSAHQLPVPVIRLNEFLADTQRVGDGIVVLQPGWEEKLEQNKQAFMSEFVQRPTFVNAFPNAMTPAEFIDRLNQNAGTVLSSGERQSLINLFSGAPNTTNQLARAQALRAVAEDQDLQTAELNRAFVLMQYFGYLRRNPNDPQDADYTGYEYWLNKLNEFHGDHVASEMVKAFLTSTEYTNRFGN